MKKMKDVNDSEKVINMGEDFGSGTRVCKVEKRVMSSRILT